MKTSDANTEVTEKLSRLIPAEKVTEVRFGDGFIVIYFDAPKMAEATRNGVQPLRLSAGHGPAGRIINAIA